MHNNRQKVFLAAAFLGFGFFVAGSATTPNLTVITHDSFDVSKTLIKNFEQQNSVRLKFIKGGDAGAMLNKLVLSKAAPIADVAYGIDNTLLARALQENIFETYKPKLASNLAAEYVLDPSWRVSTVDYGFVSLNIDKAWLKTSKFPPIETLMDLTKPEHSGQLVVENPATSSTGLAFLYATVKTFGETGYLKFWQALRQNNVLVTSGWDAAYNTEFKKNGGTRPIVVSYASSPAAEAFYAKSKDTPTQNLLLPGSSFLQIEGVGVLRGTKQRKAAQAFIDFMQSEKVQSDFPTRMWVYPINANAKLDPIFNLAEKPGAGVAVSLSTKTIAQNGARYVDAWTKVVMQGADANEVK